MKNRRQESERYQRGIKLVQKLYGETATRTLGGLDDLAPQLADYIVEFAFGDIFSRPQLDLRQRELAAVAALTALGTAPTQLRVHIEGALNAGCTRQEIVEVIVEMCIYAGFPAALNGVQAAKEVFANTAKTKKSTK